MVAQAFCISPTDSDQFARQLARRFRWWLFGVPAGIGLATLKSIIKLWFGFSPSRSGVFSAGNGPAMRSPILGVAIDDIERLRIFVRASTRITHTDPKALHGAFAVAVAAWCAKRGLDDLAQFFVQYRSAVGDDTSDEFNELMAKVEESVKALQQYDSIDFRKYFDMPAKQGSAADMIAVLFSKAVPQVYWFYLVETFCSLWNEQSPLTAATELSSAGAHR